MPLAEFSLIDRYFAAQAHRRDDVALGIGDDAAVVDVPAGESLVVAVDTLVAGVHFPPDTAPADIGHKALAVNLSDLAAMGADPRWATLALTLPRADEGWVAGFADGFFALAERFQVELIGGDTTRGPLTVSVQIMGTVPAGQALRRAGTRPGDRIFVTGTLGAAGVALRHLQAGGAADVEPWPALLARLRRPEPRVAAGVALRGLASAAIDISDGLAADLGHVLTAGAVGATVWVDRLPRATAFRQVVAAGSPDWHGLPLAAGDDYELCFTVPAAHVAAVAARLDGLAVTEIGVIEAQPGLRCVRDDGRAFRLEREGYVHFT